MSDDAVILNITLGRIRYLGYAELANVHKRFRNRMRRNTTEAKILEVWGKSNLVVREGLVATCPPVKPKRKWTFFTIRDIFWLTLVLGIVLSKYVHEPTHLECPCCGSMYDLGTIRSVSDY